MTKFCCIHFRTPCINKNAIFNTSYFVDADFQVNFYIGWSNLNIWIYFQDKTQNIENIRILLLSVLCTDSTSFNYGIVDGLLTNRFLQRASQKKSNRVRSSDIGGQSPSKRLYHSYFHLLNFSRLGHPVYEYIRIFSWVLQLQYLCFCKQSFALSGRYEAQIGNTSNVISQAHTVSNNPFVSSIRHLLLFHAKTHQNNGTLFFSNCV